jgi:hypothetical protein
MQVLNWDDINSLAVKQMGKRAVYVHCGDPATDEVAVSTAWHSVVNSMKSMCKYGTDDFFNVCAILSNTSLFFFDTKEEQDTFYSAFEHPSVESSAIYACTYDENGVGLTENT